MCKSAAGRRWARGRQGAAACLALLAWTVLQGVAAAEVVINELHVDPDVKVELVEFVELWNSGPDEVDLTDWTISGGVQYTFPTGTLLSAGTTLVVAESPPSLASKFAAPALGPYVGRLANDGERITLRDAASELVDQVDYGLGFPWPTVGDPPGFSMQLLNPALDNDLGGSWRSGPPTPGAVNAVLAATNNVPPQIRQVDHVPNQPVSGDAVLVTAKVTDPDGVASVTLLYQVLAPGAYVALDDAAYESNWVPAPMHDDGLDGDEQAGDAVFTVALPTTVQFHRRLVRYRVLAVDALANEQLVPYPDDPQPNFAYFVYDGVPAWSGAARPGAPGELGEVVDYGTNVMRSLPVYHLISKQADVESCTWTSLYGGMEYLWTGALVYDGKVYDHIHYRARGGVWRYSMGKNMWKFDFNRGHYFQARDAWGRKYNTKWDKLNFSACIQQGNFGQRGEQGMFEAAGFRLFDLAGVPSCETHYVQFRIIDEAAETGATQYDGDLWGLYLAIEQMDGRFLDEHKLPDGNLYKMEGGTGTLNNQGLTAVDDRSDLDNFIAGYTVVPAPTESWWRQNVNLPYYYNYRAIVEGIQHYDIGGGKNYFYYLNPEAVVDDQGPHYLWSQHPWDLDLTWSVNYYASGGGLSPFKRYGLLDQPGLALEYRNRVREIRDLLFNTEQAYQVIDEFAAMIDDPQGGPSIVDVDRAMWDYNPIMTSIHVNLSKADEGRFYQAFPTLDFPGMVQGMKDYLVYRDTDFLEPQSADPQIPDTPVAMPADTNFAIDRLTFQCSAFSDPQGSGTFGALMWRVGEVSDPSAPVYDPQDPLKYEIEAVWESGEIDTPVYEITVPPEALKVGHAYRLRVRMTDSSGRSSHWSSPVAFTAREPDGSADLRDYLRLGELMFNPPGGKEFEFVELCNISPFTELDLGGAGFSSGIDYLFPSGTSLAPGARLLLVKAGTPEELAAFRAVYGLDGSVPLLGPYDGKLSDSGEELVLKTAPAGSQILSFAYRDGRGWPPEADGAGHSLVPLVWAGQGEGLLDYGGNWRASAYVNGSPGQVDPDPVRDVIISEIMAHTDTGLPPPQDSDDWFELLNVSTAAVDIGGWGLGDQSDGLAKWTVPPGTVLDASERVVFREMTSFHTNSVDGFGLDKAGEQLFLSVPAGATNARVADAVAFKGQDRDFSISRQPDDGQWWFQTVPTEDAVNAAAESVVVIAEIMAEPMGAGGIEDPQLEFVEILNITDLPVELTGEAGPWRLQTAVDYVFPSNTVLAAGERVLAVGFDPDVETTARDAFMSAYDLVPGQVRMFGPWTGRLSGRGERLALERPQLPDLVGDDVSWVIEDEAIYFMQSPWPSGASLTGRSLQRYDLGAHGSDPLGWSGSDASPGGPPPMISIVSPDDGAGFVVPFSLTVRAAVDAFQVSGTVQRVELFEGDTSIGTRDTEPYEWGFSADELEGNYVFRAELTDAEGTWTSRLVTVVVYSAPSVEQQGADGITDFSASMHGRLVMGGQADVTVCYGTSDGGYLKTAWEHSVEVGNVGQGPFSAYTDRLEADTLYHFRCYARSEHGENWSQAGHFRTKSFETWDYRMRLGFEEYDGTPLEGFPLAVRLRESIEGFSYAQFSSGQAADLRFADETGQVLSYEIEEWNPAGESVIWVRVDELTADGHIWMYWGNATVAEAPDPGSDSSVWVAGYGGVWHLAGDGADSSPTGNDGVVFGAAGTVGVMSGALSFDGSDGVLVPYLPKDGAEVTVSAWIWLDAYADSGVIACNSGTTDPGQFSFQQHDGTGRLTGWLAEEDDDEIQVMHSGRSGLPLGEWHYVVLRARDGEARLFRNGDDVTSVVEPYDGSLNSRFLPLGIGARPNETGGLAGNGWVGKIDEVRVSTVGRSPDWIAACWANGNGALVSYGPVEEQSPTGDGDGDGMPDWWEQLHGLDAGQGGDAMLDSDGDGLLNIEEYEVDTIPTNPLSVLQLTGLELADPAGVVVAWQSSTAIVYSVYKSAANRNDWSETPLRSNIWGDVSGTTRYVDVSAEFAPGFFRVTGQRPGPLSGDEDEDGLPDYWEVEHFGSIANGFPETDWDLDGRTNAEELEEGTGPADPDSFLRPTDISRTAQGIRISWTSESDRLYDLYRTHDLVSGWPPLPLQADIPGQPSGITTYLDTDSGDSAAYYRILGRDPNR